MEEQKNVLTSPIKVGSLGSSEKAEFIRQTYLHVAFAVLAFVLVEMIFFQLDFMWQFSMWAVSGRWTWLILLGVLSLIGGFATNWAKSASKGMQYAGLMLYVVIQSVIFMPMLIYVIYVLEDTALLSQAAVVTLALFAGLTAIVLTTKKDFSYLRSALMVGGLIAVGLIVAGAIFGFSLGLWFSVGMVVLMGIAILYQTSQLIHEYNTDQHVAASIGLFASLMTMFWYILRIFISLSGDD